MRSANRKTIVKELFVIISISILTGCASMQRSSTQAIPPEAPAVESEPTQEVSSKIPVLKEPVPSIEKPEFYVHKVRWLGETISVIAQWYTGTPKNWEAIAKVNSDFDPKRMGIGDTILIPADILKTREPMPRKYLRTSVPKDDASPPSLVKPETESDKAEALDSPEKDQQVAEFDEIELFELQDIEEAVTQSDENELFEPVE